MYGDPALQNVMAMSNSLTALAGVVRQNADADKKRLYEEQYNAHLKGFQESPEYKPDSAAPGYDPDAFNKAAIANAQRMSQDEGVKAQRFQNLGLEMEKTRSDLMNIGQRAESIATTNPDAAVAAYMEGYSRHPNGINVAQDKNTGKWVFTDTITGQSWSQPVTLDEARQTFQATMQKGEYEKMYLSDRTRIKRYNLAAAQNPDVLEDSSGKTIFKADFIDKATGEKRTHFWDAGGNVVDLTADQILKGGIRMKADRQKERLAELGIKSEEAGIAEKNAGTDLKGAQTEGVRMENKRASAGAGKDFKISEYTNRLDALLRGSFASGKSGVALFTEEGPTAAGEEALQKARAFIDENGDKPPAQLSFTEKRKLREATDAWAYWEQMRDAIVGRSRGGQQTGGNAAPSWRDF